MSANQTPEHGQDTLLDSAETLRPNISVEYLQKLIQEKYSLTIQKTKDLPSYDDQNFLLSIFGSSDRYVFKVTSTSKKFLECIHNITQQVAKHSERTICPEVLLSNQNEAVFEISLPGDSDSNSSSTTFRCIMMKYLEGTTLIDIKLDTLADNEFNSLFTTIGKELAIMDRILSEQCEEDAAKRVLYYWDVARTLDISNLVGDKNIPCMERRKKIIGILDDFKTKFLPRIDEFRKSIIHNDANSSNIIVNKKDGKWEIGFIDFLDLIYSCTIFELAISIAYNMQLHPNRPFDIAQAQVRAYHEEFPLTAEEIQILPTLIKARIATSVTLCARKKRDEPENEYLSINEQTGWHLLDTLCTLTSDSFASVLSATLPKDFKK